MSTYLHPRIELLLSAMGGLEAAARDLTVSARKRADERRRRSRGGTLRPGTDTQLWNALSAAVGAQLRKRGERALLARELGVHRARIGEYFDRQTAMPDAERTLLLLLWLNRRAMAEKNRAPKA